VSVFASSSYPACNRQKLDCTMQRVNILIGEAELLKMKSHICNQEGHVAIQYILVTK